MNCQSPLKEASHSHGYTSVTNKGKRNRQGCAHPACLAETRPLGSVVHTRRKDRAGRVVVGSTNVGAKKVVSSLGISPQPWDGVGAVTGVQQTLVLQIANRHCPEHAFIQSVTENPEPWSCNNCQLDTHGMTGAECHAHLESMLCEGGEEQGSAQVRLGLLRSCGVRYSEVSVVSPSWQGRLVCRACSQACCVIARNCNKGDQVR